VRVTILHVNDVYQFMPVEGGTRGGLARLLTLKKQALQENPNTIFTLGGDTLSPSVETQHLQGRADDRRVERGRLDYAVLGNHEFDIKTDGSAGANEGIEIQWLGANVFDKKTQKIFADTAAVCDARIRRRENRHRSAFCCPKPNRLLQWKKAEG
jgi:5'-nucleotidase